MLHATLLKEYQHFDHHFSGSIVLRAASLIAAYSPLIAQQAGAGNQFGGYWFDLVQAEGSAQLECLESLYLVPGTHLDVLSFQVTDQSNSKHLTAGGKEIQSSIYLDDKDLFVRTVYGRFIFTVKSLYESTTLLVVPDLPLALGGPMTWVLPPNYTTSSRLPSSSEIYTSGIIRVGKGRLLILC
ncbi:hypothetical protein RJ641_023010 [Dillenia turbinata]|uniref:Uncharacterized protein n=1 Tax=Dillenia turbinata TaxID=194707 RepID=A0AAN8YS85_9MAGN